MTARIMLALAGALFAVWLILPAAEARQDRVLNETALRGKRKRGKRN